LLSHEFDSIASPNNRADARSEATVTELLRDLRVEERSIASLKLGRNNPRTHSKKQIRQIADSIKTFGFTNPALVDAGSTVIAGHGRVMAARLLGLETVPTIRLDHLTEAQIRAYVIADNKLAENAGWDRELLALELQGLETLDLGFDLTVTGFETAEIDLLIGDLAPGRSLAYRAAPPPLRRRHRRDGLRPGHGGPGMPDGVRRPTL
jgi:ParB-like chromosome segregation protein Spo0J